MQHKPIILSIFVIFAGLFLSYGALRAADTTTTTPEPKTKSLDSSTSLEKSVGPFQNLLKHFEELQKKFSSSDPFKHPFSLDPFSPEWEKNLDNMFKDLTGPSLNFGLHFPLSSGKSLTMPTQIQEKDGAYVITIDIPGVDKKAIDLKAREKSIVISTERKSLTTEEKDQKIHRQEISYGRMSRIIELPGPILEDKVTASYDNGVLTVIAPMNPAPRKDADGYSVQIN